MTINKVAVLGSGVMGSAIAAHLANAGIPSLLLDIMPPELTEEDKKAGLSCDNPRWRNRFAIRAMQETLPKLRPAAVFEPEVMRLITPGNFEDDISRIKECDWVIEVVVERLDIKRKLFQRVEKNLKPGAIVSSNTSGIRLKELVEGRAEGFARNFLITHFFNPVRYMKLVEVVSGPKTEPKVVETMAAFLSERLGKGVVYAKDTPSFIANRIGIYSLMNVVHCTLEMGLPVEAVDKITGPATGKPKSASFRTADLAGLDTIAHVAKNNMEALPNDEGREALNLPPIVQRMLENKWLGDKTGQGFYKKTKTDGKTEILSLNLKTCEYGPRENVRYDCLGAAKNIEDPGERVKTVLAGDDPAARFAWRTIRDSLVYAANRVPEIADDIIALDNAMRWGFNWDLGPFELLDALGVKEFAERLAKDGIKMPALIESVLKDGAGRFYQSEGGRRFFFDVRSKSYREVPVKPSHLVIKTLKETKHTVKENDGASIVDLGDGVVCVEFHTKMNAIDADVALMLEEAVDIVESRSEYAGLVISNDAPNFSVGANLMLLWMESQQKNWEGIGNMIKGFQAVCQRLRFAKKPVVAAPAGLALGGGCEIIMSCHAVRAYAETYVGLVEVGAGLIPGGGGNKNLMLNIEAMLREKGVEGWAGKSDGGPFPKVQKCFETIGFARVAVSAVEGSRLGYFPKATRITMLRDLLLHDAKRDVLELAKGFKPAAQREDILVPGVGGKMALFAAISGFEKLGKLSEHDALIGRKLAHVLCGGDIPTQARVSEQYLLDIEREAFMSLCAEEKTQARMQALLMTGKPLRN